MAKRHKGTTRTRADRKPTAAQRESATASGFDLLSRLDRRHRERVILDALTSLASRTSRVDGPRSTAFTALDLSTQFEAAGRYLLDLASTKEIYDALGARVAAVSTRVFENWISIVKAEYVRRLSESLANVAHEDELHDMRGDLPALAARMWSELAVKAIAYVRNVDYSQLDNNTRHLLQRVAEGSTDAAKVFTEVKKTEAQTEKILRQLRQDVADAAKRSRGALSLATVSKIIDEALGLPGREAAT